MTIRESSATLAGAEEYPGQHVLAVEKLGRERPVFFSTTWEEAIFVFCLLNSLAMADFIIGGFQVVLPSLVEHFDIPPASQTWPSSVLTLVVGAFLFPVGRIVDLYESRIVFNAGLVWFSVWVAAAGFAQNFNTLVVCRAMEGLGAAAFLPGGIALLGRIYRPGPRKNLIFALYSATAPIGFALGIVIGGLSQDLLSWRWYFWLGGIISAVCCVGSILTLPRDQVEVGKTIVTMDWLGTCTIVPGLMLSVYAITESTNASNGWSTPEIAVTLSLGLLFLAAAIYIEGWVVASPLIPPDIFRVANMKLMLCCLLLSWGVFAIYLLYSNLYIQLVLGRPALLTAAYFAPWAIGAVTLSTLSGLLLHVVPGQVLLLISGALEVLAVLFFALIPEKPNYWAWVLPPMLCVGVSVHVLWTVSNVFLTTSLPRHRQGLAGAMVNFTLFIGGALVLGIANVAKGRLKTTGMGLRAQYKGVFWIGVALAVMAIILCSCIKLGKAGCTSTVEETTWEAAEEAETADNHRRCRRRGMQDSKATAAESGFKTIKTAEMLAKDAIIVFPLPTWRG